MYIQYFVVKFLTRIGDSFWIKTNSNFISENRELRIELIFILRKWDVVSLFDWVFITDLFKLSGQDRERLNLFILKYLCLCSATLYPFSKPSFCHFLLDLVIRNSDLTKREQSINKLIGLKNMTNIMLLHNETRALNKHCKKRKKNVLSRLSLWFQWVVLYIIAWGQRSSNNNWGNLTRSYRM